MATQTQKKATSASSYKKQIVAKVEVPSGAVVRIKAPGMDSFLRRGFIPDALTPLVRRAMSGKDVDDQLEDLFEDFNDDEGKLKQLLEMMDKIVIDTWVEPEVHPVPDDDNDRDEELLYADEVHFEDKNFTFQYVVGGTKDLESFRREQSSMLERVPSGEDVEQATE